MSSADNKPLETNIEILEHLNNVSYSKIVIQIIKYLLFTRGQIPCTYETLNILMNKHLNLSENEKSKNFMVEKRFNYVLKTVQTLEKMFENLITEFRTEPNHINEIAIIFGSTPVTPKEVYNINWKICESLELKEVQRQDRIVLQILRNLLTSSDLQQHTTKTLPLTNMFLLVKKQQSETNTGDLFVPKEKYIIPERTQRFNIKLSHKHQCNSIDYPINDNVEVLETTTESLNLSLSELSDAEDDLSPIKNIDNEYKMIRGILSERLKNQPTFLWFQSKEFFKGFKDELVNGQSIWQ